MPDVLLLLDTALRGALRALLGVALGLGLCVQVLSSAPWFEAGVARVWQAPAVAVSGGQRAAVLALCPGLVRRPLCPAALARWGVAGRGRAQRGQLRLACGQRVIAGEHRRGCAAHAAPGFRHPGAVGGLAPWQKR